MATVYVSYDDEDGWRVVDAATLEQSVPRWPSFTCWQSRSYLNDGDDLKLRATFEHGLNDERLSGLTARAEKWLIDAGLARKQAGMLIVDWPKVNQELGRLAAERREGA